MIKDEAYEAMGKGYPITHKQFKQNEYLYMDENYIIRDEQDNEFEAEWDTSVDAQWLKDWFIYKGEFNKPTGASRELLLNMDRQAFLKDNGLRSPLEPYLSASDIYTIEREEEQNRIEMDNNTPTSGTSKGSNRNAKMIIMIFIMYIIGLGIDSYILTTYGEGTNVILPIVLLLDNILSSINLFLSGYIVYNLMDSKMRDDN